MMDDFGDVKVFRKNIMFVSVVSILLLYFSLEITEINLFGIIKISNVQNEKVLGVMLLLNLYVFLRYFVAFNKEKPRMDKREIFKYLLNSLHYSENTDSKTKFPKITGKFYQVSQNEQQRLYYRYYITEFDCLMIGEKAGDNFHYRLSENYTNIFFDDTIVSIEGIYKYRLYKIEELPNPRGYILVIDKNFKNTFVLFKVYFKFILQNNYILDYYLPFCMILFSIWYILSKII